MQEKLILVLNCGSSSIKFAILNPENAKVKINGLVQCIGQEEASIGWKYQGEK